MANDNETKQHQRYWTTREIKWLEEFCETMTTGELAIELDRQYSSVYLKLKELGLSSRRTINYWTGEEIKALRELSATKTVAEIADILGRSYCSVYVKAAEIEVECFSTLSHWSGRESKWVKDNAPTKTVEQMAIELGRPQSSVRYQLRAMGIKSHSRTPRHSWTQQDLDRIKSMREKGETWENIATDLGVATTTLDRFLKLRGLK